MKVFSKKIYFIGTAILAALICFTIITIYSVTTRKSSSKAETDKVKVEVAKLNTVSLYVSGESVTKLDTSFSEDVYQVDKGSTIVLRCVNESRLFTEWVITGTYVKNSEASSLNDSCIEITVNGDLKVSTNRKDPTISDSGKYIDSAFVISEEEHAMYLQNIFELQKDWNSNTNFLNLLEEEDLKKFYNSYEHFYQSDNKFKINVIDKKLDYKAALEYIKENNDYYFGGIQKGYYKVQQSFTILNSEFKGIGNKEFPFQGVICGSDNANTTNAQIFSSISINETDSDMYCGLFGSIDKNAVIRNLNLKSSVAISKVDDMSNNESVYMGGVAGIDEGALLSNLNVSAVFSASTTNKNIYAGGIAGKMSGGINAHHNVSFDFSNQSWVLTSNSQNTNIYGGIIAGYADDVYVHLATIDVSGFAVNAKNIVSADYNNNIYIGNLFGYYKNTTQRLIDNITITGNNAEYIHSIIAGGSSYVGGLIGYVNAEDNPLLIGKVTFNMDSKATSKLYSESYNHDSKANIYSAGLFAYINGNQLKATDSFKQGITTIYVDETPVDEYHFIFDTPMEIQAKQHGLQPNSTVYGNCIAGGLIGEGYFDISGNSNEQRTKIFVTSSDNVFSVQAIQTSSSNHELTTKDVFVGADKLTNNNRRHCLSSLLFGCLSEESDTNDQYSFKFIDVYANNATIEATREIGSRSLGDVSASGFASYAKGRNLTDITMYLGDNTSIIANSLSYEVGYEGNNGKKASANNNYVGAFIANMIGVNSDNKISNIEINGFDFDTKEKIGTDILIQGIQNSMACYNNTSNNTSTSKDYSNENYVGGVIGCLKGDYTLENVSFIGNDERTSEIFMQGHRDPNSAFVGGIVGLSELLNNEDGTVSSANQTFTNCKIKNANIIGNATITSTAYNYPDIYGGGIIGACYTDEKAGTLTIENSKVLYTDINCTGNERIETYVGGIVGTKTWTGNIKINNSYVYKSKVSATVDASKVIIKSSVSAKAAGIICDVRGGNVKISNVAVIDTEISAYTSENAKKSETETIAAGFNARKYITVNSITIENSYTNSKLTSYYGSTSATRYTTASSAGNSVYYTSNNKFENNKGFELNFEPKYITGDTAINSNSIFNNLNKNDAKENKIYLNILDGDFTFVYDDKNIGKVICPSSASTSEAEVWINAKIGNSISDPTILTEDEQIENGWFKLGNIYLINNSTTNSGTINNLNTFYSYDGSTYYKYLEYDSTNENHIFENTSDSTDQLFNLGYEEYENNDKFGKLSSITKGDYFCYKIATKLKSTLPSIKITFKINVESNGTVPTYYVNWFEKVGNSYSKVIMSESSNLGYGSYSYTFNTVTSEYELIYTPNVELENDAEIYVAFYKINQENGSAELEYANEYLYFDLIANKYVLTGATLASYTPALNTGDNNDNLGTSNENPWHFQVGTSYRLIPIFERCNELGKKIISELYTQKVNYKLDETDTNNSVKSNGELTTPSTISEDTYAVTYTVTLTLKDDETKPLTFYFKVAKKYTVSINSDGANYTGLPFATNISDYYLDIEVLSHCGGIPTTFKITIDGTEYDLTKNYKSWICDENGEKLGDWNNSLSKYRIKIPYSVKDNDGNKNIITSNINIDISFPINFTIEFHIQTDLFNSKFTGEKTKVYKVDQGKTFNDLFGTEEDSNENLKELRNELNTWISSADEASFGYLFTGFYLIEDSSSISSYGQSFEDLCKNNLSINTSYVFYARWSFLIELIEAPGTQIKTSFNQDFLYEVKSSEHTGLLNRNVIIPINNNRGYVFTIVKDKNFIGEADVEAYVINKQDEVQKITQIPIEKYHNNMYLYYIKPEFITGYLVIATKISNSEIIVGENDASITEDVLPEDGIYTFKYIANHVSGKTYIYNGVSGNNLELPRNLKLEFKEQKYDSTTNKLSIVDRCLAKGTVVEVYYNKYIDAGTTSSETIVGRYVVTNDDTSIIKLSDFTKFDGFINDSKDKAFKDITFKELLDNTESLSEIYYFVVIPPNGINTHRNNNGYGEYRNEYLYVGYCDTNGDYISGSRSENKVFTNIPISELLKNQLQYETSLQLKQYSIFPSRDTKLDSDAENNNKYHFEDNHKFKVFDVTITNGDMTSVNKVILNELTEIISSEISQGISKLILNLGYKTGNIDVYGSTDNTEYTLIDTIKVDKVTYKDYDVEFPSAVQYKYFKIVSNNTQEIRLSKITLVVNETSMSYELEFSKTDFDNLYVPNYIGENITSIDLPLLTDLSWSVSDSDYVRIENGVLKIVDLSSRNDDDQEVTLTASYMQNNSINTKEFKITIQGKNSSNSLDLSSLHLPYQVVGSFVLPTYSGLSWSTDNSSVEIKDNNVILNGESCDVTLIANYGGNSQSFVVHMIENSSIYSYEKSITGDTRHDGMSFVLAVQIKKDGSIIPGIDKVTITVNGKEYAPVINNSGSNLVAYFDLTTIKNELGTTSFDLTINIPSDYSISAVQLLEVENIYKPAMGEVRTTIDKNAKN